MPARGGSRRSPRTRARARRPRARASPRTARGARRASPSAASGRRRRGSACGGTGRRRRRRSSSGRGGSGRASIERRRGSGRRRPQRGGRELAHRLAVEHAALDRHAREQRPLLLGQPVEARAEQRLDRGRHRQLPRTRRASSRALAAAGRRRSASRAAPRRTADCPRCAARCARRRPASSAPARGSPRARRLSSGLSGSSRIEVAFSLPPPQPARIVEQLGPRHAEQDDRRVAREVRHVLDQVEEGRLRPLEVVEHDHERRRRASASNSRRTAQKIFSLVPARVAEADRLGQHVGDQVGLRLPGQLRRHRVARPRGRAAPRPPRRGRAPPRRAASR